MRKVLMIIGGLIIAYSASAETEIEALTKRVKELEDALFYAKFSGVLFGLTTIWAGYMWFKGIKNKVDEVIEKDANNKIEEISSKLVNEKLEKYPFIVDFNKREALKKKSVLIVSKVGKNVKFNALLNTNGFSNITNKAINDFSSIDENDHEIILFNNENGDLSFQEIDRVIEKYNGKLSFLYYSLKEDRFTSIHDVKNILFANSEKTLSPRLTQALS